MLRRISPQGTRQRRTGKWLLIAAATLLAVAAVWLFRPARESPAMPAEAEEEAPRPRSGYENRALWQAPASPAARAPGITGTVYDLQGNPLAGALVTAVTFQLAGNQPARAGSGQTDTSGRFALALPAGSYYVSGDKKGYGPARIVAHSGDDVGLVLVPSGVISGRVTGERNEPIQRFSIDVIGPLTDDMAAPAPFVSKRFDSLDGTFRLDQLPDYPVTLRATAEGHAPSVSELLQIKPGETRTVDLALGAGCTLTGTVQDEQGSPLAEVFVDAELRADAGIIGPASIDAISQADTDHEGRFTLEHVPLGDVLIRTYDGTHAVSTATTRIDDCNDLAPITLHMSSGSELSGVVRTSAGEPVADARVTLTHRSIGFVSTTSDHEGHYRFEKLPAGTMRIEAVRGAQRAVTLVAVPESGAAERDLPFPAEGTGEIRGRITASGKPLAGMQLMVVTHKGQGMLDTVYPITAMDGSYRAAGLTPGAYTIIVMSTSRLTAVLVKSGAVETADMDVAVKPEAIEQSEETKEKIRAIQEQLAARQNAAEQNGEPPEAVEAPDPEAEQ